MMKKDNKIESISEMQININGSLGNLKQKSIPTKTISEIQVGKKDSTGNTIISVLARGDEYAIYEIEAKKPEDCLRLNIDGHTDQSDAEIVKRYTKVKQEYVLAKGLLYRSSNFNLMKNRVAHALSSALSGHEKHPNEIFNKLILEIKNEYKSIIWRRLIYILPGYITLLILGIHAVVNIYFKNYLSSEALTSMIMFITATTIGGVLSMTYNIRKFTIEPEPHGIYYFLIGFERLSLCIFAGIIIYVAIKSKIIFGETITSNPYSSIFLGFMAGFSESLVPNILKKDIQ